MHCFRASSLPAPLTNNRPQSSQALVVQHLRLQPPNRRICTLISTTFAIDRIEEAARERPAKGEPAIPAQSRSGCSKTTAGQQRAIATASSCITKLTAANSGHSGHGHSPPHSLRQAHMSNMSQHLQAHTAAAAAMIVARATKQLAQQQTI